MRNDSQAIQYGIAGVNKTMIKLWMDFSDKLIACPHVYKYSRTL